MSVAQLDSQLCFALYTASNHLTSIYRPLLEPLKLTYTQFVVLMALWEEDNVSISALAMKTGLSKATMTPLLKRLEQKQLIERQLLADNERQKNIVLTDEGRELSLKSEAITNQAFCETGLTKKQATDLMALCHKIVEQKP
ncbi:MarR family winged helix-turn-helix transcriptional regulator [Pleionea sp. CnH1-48]|uniref:MarR family winged helix-turn-helix transcriptional regulator n=1 Tax=Pleionea sp. CnH1-48 TaxID=2954494 RepID=UPI002096CDD0|nr:MarR family transcriptional regulator [Pleionea sp. CnH1-48]MCO7224109.1 MarR family transcriptional regulator [Pleionea sp. CnH1-48]